MGKNRAERSLHIDDIAGRRGDLCPVDHDNIARKTIHFFDDEPVAALQIRNVGGRSKCGVTDRNGS